MKEAEEQRRHRRLSGASVEEKKHVVLTMSISKLLRGLCTGMKISNKLQLCFLV